ncbi:polysaccharide pyruvyl transferase family protein [Clostridium grantii]|uniref:Colanic acid/amylovoran biosynthesis protein n=1 Tax=Clostridium grantii DSM 8605 TaxID=1121316 RepID=A0A1M5UZF6_9CLOT|nr:polysaccharide pyruvyl transferase family protein [Clostridium grantii]SHH68349.1 colanic acid/amylovoran biosynthesis protein [Clostridium grantii DSM 8605]
MKKIFIDVYLAFNLGDDLFLDIIAKKYPNCSFTVNYVGGDYDKFISQYNNVNRRNYNLINKIMRRLKIKDALTEYNRIAEEHDALIFLGGSIFREEEYHQSLYKDRMNMVKEFKNREKPIFVLGANFGPFETQGFINDYRRFFELCKDVCFRDTDSYELFNDMLNVRYEPDIVFQMDIEKYKNKKNKKRIGFSIIDVRHKQGLAMYHEEYINSSVKSLELLTASGYDCYLMSFCQREGDLDVINAIKSNLTLESLKKISIYEYKGNLTEVIELISTFQLFIAARFHANIIGLLLGTSILPIIYSKKTINMLRDINFNNILINMNELHLLYDNKVLKRALDNNLLLGDLSKKAEKQFNKLNTFLIN